MGEGNACYALADAHEAAGDIAGGPHFMVLRFMLWSDAIKFLESYYEVAQMTGELASQGEACSRLGVIYHSQVWLWHACCEGSNRCKGDYANSVHYFEKAFEMARSLGDQKGVSIARVNLGVARGQAKFGVFVKVPC